MSDAIREAFEALARVSNYASVPFEMMTQFADDVDTIKAALQSQTAPAAPQPDHSPDAGKVVGDHYDLGVALSRHFDELRDSETGHIAFDPCDSNDIDEVLAIINAHLSPTPAAGGGKVVQGEPVASEVEVNRVANAILEAWKKAEPDHSITKHPISYIATFADMARAAIAATHPAESREEIQARALEAYARDLDSVHKAAKRQHASNTPAWYAGQFAKDARAAAASLRASQQEGGEA